MTPEVEDRSRYIIDSDSEEGNNNCQSDLCRIALNIAFMREQDGRAFQYSKERLTEQTQELLEAARARKEAKEQEGNQLLDGDKSPRVD